MSAPDPVEYVELFEGYLALWRAGQMEADEFARLIESDSRMRTWWEKRQPKEDE